MVSVPQLRPPFVERAAWAGDDFVIAWHAGRAYVWDTVRDRVVSIERMEDEPSGPELSTGAGYLHGAERFLLARGHWDHVVSLENRQSFIAAPNLRRFAVNDEDEVVVLSEKGELSRLPRGRSAHLSWDGARLLVCSDDGLMMYDTARGTVRASYRQAIERCAWNDGRGPIAVTGIDGVRFLEETALEPIGPSFPGATRGSVARDGHRAALVMTGGREGILVVDIERGTELAFHAISGVRAVRFVGEVLAYAGPAGMGMISLAGETTMLPSRRMGFGDVTRSGRTFRLIDGELSVRDARGIEHRWRHDVMAWGEIDDGSVFAHTETAVHRLTLEPLGSVAFARCDGARWRADALPPTSLVLHRGEVSALVSDGCIARHDRPSITIASSPAARSAAFDRFVGVHDGTASVLDIDGHVVSRLAVPLVGCLDAGSCPARFRMTPDGRVVLASTAATILALSADDGALVAQRVLPARIRQLTALDDHNALAVDDGGRRWVLTLPGLDARGLWLGPRGSERRDVVPVGSLVADVGDDHLRLRDLDGAVVGWRIHDGEGAVALPGYVGIERPAALLRLDMADAFTLPGEWATPSREWLDREALTCADGHLVRTSLGDVPSSRHLPDVPCEGRVVRPLREGWLSVRSATPILVAPDDRRFDLWISERPQGIAFALHRDGELWSDGIEVVRRPASLYDTRVEALPSRGSPATWLAAR